jgi:uncharacterized protein (TIGR00369 family)
MTEVNTTSDPAGAHTDWGTPRTKTISWYDPMLSAAAGRSLTGIEMLRAIRDGEIPRPPIAAVFGFEITEVEPGLVVFSCVPDESAYNPIGVVHGGLVCTLADTVSACAVHTTLEAGVAYTSIDLNVSYLRPVTLDSGALTATGRLTKPGRRVAFSSAEIVDCRGKLVATATSSCLIMER